MGRIIQSPTFDRSFSTWLRGTGLIFCSFVLLYEYYKTAKQELLSTCCLRDMSLTKQSQMTKFHGFNVNLTLKIRAQPPKKTQHIHKYLQLYVSLGTHT